MTPAQFNKLRAKWYAKLKASGFDDIESDDDNLKKWSSQFADTRLLVPLLAKEQYYQMANRFLNEYQFANNRERIIWEYHANGISIRKIVKLLKKARVKTYRRAVWVTVDRLRATMKSMYMGEK